MAKFHGVIGYAEMTETRPGVFKEDKIIERPYSGDIIQDTRRWESSEALNDSLMVTNTISIVGDLFAYKKFYAMRYVKWMGVSWKITKVEIKRPRLILTIGEVYHGQQ